MISTFLEGNGLGWNVLQIDEHRSVTTSSTSPWTRCSSTCARQRESRGCSLRPSRRRFANWRTDHEGFFREFDKLAIDSRQAPCRDRGAALDRTRLSVLIVLTLGYFAGGFVGRGLVASIDRTLNSIPFVKLRLPVHTAVRRLSSLREEGRVRIGRRRGVSVGGHLDDRLRDEQRLEEPDAALGLALRGCLRTFRPRCR